MIRGPERGYVVFGEEKEKDIRVVRCLVQKILFLGYTKLSGMRISFLPIAIALFFLSCQKSSDSNGNTNPTSCTEPSATLQYKFDGTLIQMNGSLSQNSKEGSLIRKEQVTGTGNPNPQDNSNGTILTNTNLVFSLAATKNYYYSDDGEPILEVEFRTSNITAPSTFTKANNGVKYVMTYYPNQGVSESNWDFTLNITKVENGYADGTFSGKLVKTGTTTYYNITEGEFKNVKILQ